MRRKLFLVLTIGCICLGGCGTMSEKAREREEIEKALNEYADKQPGFERATADRAVRLFNTDRDRAEVVMEFKSRADGSIRLMIYHMKKEGPQWQVKDARPFQPRSG